MREENGLVILSHEELAVIKKIFQQDSNIRPQTIVDAIREPTPEELEQYARDHIDLEGADWDFPNSWTFGFILGGLAGVVVTVAIIFTFYL
jgi:hypothetical protein